MSEQSRIESLARIFAGLSSAGVTLGIGDDAALLELPAGARLVASVDEQIEGTHFRRDLVSLHDIGYRATMAAASDLAAMGAAPLGILAALGLPDDIDDASFEAVARGQREAADAIGCAVVGGNLARGPVLTITTTVLGHVERPLLRAGAKAGDGIYVTGPLGLAALGFRALGSGDDREVTRAARGAWQRPRARIAEGRAARAIASAAIDVSDGLAKDLGALCAASNVSAEVDEGVLLDLAGETGAAEAARALGADVVEAILGGGEDYALVATSAAPIDGFRRIGAIAAGPPAVTLRRANGSVEPVAAGFDHFAPQPFTPRK